LPKGLLEMSEGKKWKKKEHKGSLNTSFDYEAGEGT
jgi:hypothetical protein